MPLVKLLVTLVVPLGVVAARALPAAAQSDGPPSSVAPTRTDLSGDYTGTWGATVLQQDGDHITGAYAFDDGHIDGHVVGKTLRFTWSENSGSGRGVFTVMADGTLQGTWGYGDDEANGGAWQLTSIAGGGAGKAARWEVGLRFPWDAAFTPNNVSMGVVGLGLDIGEYLAGSRWYVGGSADYELEVDMEAPDSATTMGPTAFNRLRLGGEARYEFHDGTAAVSENDGPEMPVPRHDWVGIRGGAESYDGLSTIGEFAEATIGWDAELGSSRLGMYLSAGASRESSAAFPATAPTDPAPTGQVAALATTPASTTTYVSPYVTLGIRLAFD